MAAWLVALSIGLAGCGGLKESFEDAGRVRSALKAEFGMDAKVTFSVVNGRTSVAVRLATPPRGEAIEAKRKIAEVVHRTFRTNVRGVVITF
jgi:hypothetical protein